MFVFFIHVWNLGKISIFLAFSGSFAKKNDNIHIFFFAVLVANFGFDSFAQKQKYTADNPDREKKQSERTDLPKTGFAI